MSDQPLVTVLLPVYNAEKYLQESVDSILGQTYRNLEIMAIDDGSTDSSPALLSGVSDERMNVVTNPQNLGLIRTLNRGIPLAKGKYIVRADADDICLPTRVEKQVAFMEANPDVGISGTGFGTFSDENALTENGCFSSDHNEILFKHLYQIHLMHGTSIWRKSVFIENDLQFDPDFSHAEDYDLFDRAGQITRLSNIPDVLYHIRLHDESICRKFNVIQNDNSTIIKKRGFVRLGLAVSEKQLELFRSVCHMDHNRSRGKETAVADLFLDMLKANRESQYLPQDMLIGWLTELWTGICLINIKHDNSILQLIKEHGISQFLPLDRLTKLKIRIKSVL